MYNKIQRLKPENERHYYSPPSLPLSLSSPHFSRTVKTLENHNNEYDIVQIDDNMNIKGDFISFMRDYCAR